MAELLKVADCYKYPMPWVLSSKKGGEWADTSNAWVEDYEVLRDYLRYSVNDTINLLQQHQDRLEALEQYIQKLGERNKLELETLDSIIEVIQGITKRLDILEAKETPDATTEG